MCGVVGGWLRDFEPARLETSLDLIAHRGPDGRGSYIDEASGVVLGHTRLAIIDLSETGHQPMPSDDGLVTLSFNGEIYNYRELRAVMEADGIRFRGTSDTEVLLRLYLAEGLAMLPRLNGIFAFAIHDRRRGELLLARDALGVKPLYYGVSGQGVAFASEIKALLELGEFSGLLDAAALHRYLTFLWCPGDGTPSAAIKKLPPGHAMRIRNGRIEALWRWYALPQTRPMSESLNSAARAAAAIHNGLKQAVERQLVADVPVGAFLSGGLDSSSVVAFARQHVPDIRCFTIDSPGGTDDGVSEDLPYARKVAAHLGVPLDVVTVDAERMIGGLERMVWQLDEPLADPAPLNVLYICELAREAGIKVLLSGAGGDDLFTGYRRHLALRYEGLWSWLPEVARRGLEDATALLDKRSALGQRVGRLFRGAHETGDARLATYFAWAGRDELLPLYSPDMRAAVTGIRAAEPMLDYVVDVAPERSRLDRMLALEQRFFLADHNLTYTDKMSMAASVEVRVPFLDMDLVELAARVPDRLKQRGREGKWILKKAMEPYLPREVIYRPKSGFGAPLRRWMRHDLREVLGDMLSEERLHRRGLFDPRAVQELIAENDAGRRDAAYTLFSLLCIEIWCQRFMDRSGASSTHESPGQWHSI
jgi:asparagine synthase (glutamine-hydrolysing)